MDYNNMNRRASRSAYNYDNDRSTSRRRVDNGRRRDENVDFQDFRRKPAANNTAGMNRGPANPAPRRPATAQPSHRPAVRNGNVPNGARNHNAPGAQMRGGQRTAQQMPRGARPSANQGQVRNGGANAARPNNPARKQQPKLNNNPGRAPQKQPRKSEWIYPEGYTPPRRNPAPTRNPQNGRVANNRPAGRKPAKAGPRIDWQRIGVVVGAVAFRFLCCLLVVASIYGLIYRKKFYSVEEPETKTVVYGFETVVGEGEEQEISVYEFEVDSLYAYDRDELLINFSEISKWLGTAQVGDIYSMRFVLGGETGSESVVFHNASQNAFVNGSPVVMKTSARFDNGEIWVPLSFVTDYVTGVEVKISKGAVTLGRNEHALAFTLRPVDPMMPVAQPEEN